jgi:hypothetical protein
MNALSASELLTVWEQGLHQSPTQRSLLLLLAACPERSIEQLAALSIGQRDTLLLKLREQTFGSQLISIATCPNCGDRLELTFTASEIATVPEATPEWEPAAVLSLTYDDYDIHFRLPNSLDLDALPAQADLTMAQAQLLDRCLISMQHQGEAQSAQQLPAAVLEAILEHMAQADPQANVQLALACPGCGHQWQATFDIVSFFWSEIHAWAKRILQEVHTLASAYGWREMDILAMHPQRRQVYLEMIHA